MKTIVFRSFLFWLLLTIVVSLVFVFRPSLDLARVGDDYMGYWDFRLLFFLMLWVPISLPLWALATYVLTKSKPENK